ncbi:protein AF-10-like [Hyposmocoma kahamanoa]|uniref:protein AF-10-like n=1 Tax=Hyposmocoma kahamanoa TaxID=1477025 RepID=UPI000E6D5CA0|nr:protein AF-10-like [Hyposmocoma kahamanoa]
MKEMVGGCCVCSDERGWPDNPLVYCDGNGCTVAVHQACYGIVTVPTGPWYCRKCESPETKGKVRCELCPSKSGALKRTDTGGWAHVVCALYIPEVRFGNVTSMEPIVLRLIPPERFNKQCYICQESHKSLRAVIGACMQCNKSGCKQQFHVTCAQSLGLLCEEAGNYLDNVKYCGYCQHHYSKLKKGGNVKTIPPYKPVSHDSHSSDSSGEKEGETSPMAGGGGTPTSYNKTKGPGRKSSHSGSTTGAKNSSNSSKTPTNTTQPMETNQEVTETPATATGRRHKASEKHKKKPSPSRRGSSASDAGAAGSSKSSTPTPSPQHMTDSTQTQPGKGGSTPGGSAKVPPAASSPGKSAGETGSVISSVASTAAPTTSTATNTTASTAVTTSVVQVPTSKSATYQESVITNTDLVETKQTKKRKAVSAANTPNTIVDFGAAPPTIQGTEAIARHGACRPPSRTRDLLRNELDLQNDNAQSGNNSNNAWEGPAPNDIHTEGEKVIKKAKTEAESAQAARPFSSVSPAPPPPPPPPAHSPASQPSPRHLPSPMPGPSGMNPPSNIRSPSQPGGKSDREAPASLLVSVPLPSTSHGLNLSAHAQVSAATDMPGPAPHIFHQPQKQAAMEQSVPGHLPHGVASRSSWGGLNVSYEMQQDPNKPSVSGMAGSSKDPTNLANIPMPPAPIRNKKRAAMSAMTSMPTPPPPPAQTSTQSLASVRRHPQPPPIYQETIKDSPPSSPSSDRPLKPKMESKIGASCTAPHMLGNELNPESGAAARLQEQLTAELAAHAAGTSGGDMLIPPPLINKAQSGSSGSRSGSSGAQSLDQLLERQWEQGSQFLMEQAQHFDIASLLSCLHQLRTENVRLEEHVGSLLQRRDHLLAVNARLAIPLTTVATGPPEPNRCTRDNGSQVRPPHAPLSRPAETVTSERSHQVRPDGTAYVLQMFVIIINTKIGATAEVRSDSYRLKPSMFRPGAFSRDYGGAFAMSDASASTFQRVVCCGLP